MTVGIAAICDNGNAIVMAADRLVTVGEAFLNIDMDRMKLAQLTPRVWIALTGTIQDAEYARDRFAQASHLFAGQSVLQIAKRLRKAIAHIRARQIEERILKPGIGVTYVDFTKAAVSNPTTPLMTEVYNKILNFAFDLELMVAGIDDSGAHLYRVTCFSVNSHEGLAYTTIGVGRSIAAVALSMTGYSTLSRSVNETLYRVFEAKRLSEQTGLVGLRTDMLLLRQGSEPTILPEEAISTLESIYQRRRPAAMSEDEISQIGSVVPGATLPHSPVAPESSRRRPRGRRP